MELKIWKLVSTLKSIFTYLQLKIHTSKLTILQILVKYDQLPPLKKPDLHPLSVECVVCRIGASAVLLFFSCFYLELGLGWGLQNCKNPSVELREAVDI